MSASLHGRVCLGRSCTTCNCTALIGIRGERARGMGAVMITRRLVQLWLCPPLASKDSILGYFADMLFNPNSLRYRCADHEITLHCGGILIMLMLKLRSSVASTTQLHQLLVYMYAEESASLHRANTSIRSHYCSQTWLIRRSWSSSRDIPAQVQVARV